MKVPGEHPDLFIRITHPWETVKELITTKWALYCETVVVYQHDADEQVNRTHVHMVLRKMKVCRKRLKQLAVEAYVDLVGNTNCAMEIADKNTETYTYMTKGHLEPVFLQGYPKEESDKWKAAWKEGSDYNKSKLRHIYDKFYPDACKTKNWEQLKKAAWLHLSTHRYKSLDMVGTQYFFDCYKSLCLTYITELYMLSTDEDYQNQCVYHTGERFSPFRVPVKDSWFSKALPFCLLEPDTPPQIINI